MNYRGSRRRLVVTIGLVAAAVVAVGAWLATSWMGTYQQARAFESEVSTFRAAVSAQDWSTVVADVPSLLATSRELSDRTQQAQWRVLESVPFVGSSALAATDLSRSAVALLSAVQPIAPFAARVVGGEIRAADGSLDLDLIAEVQPHLARLATVMDGEVERLDQIDTSSVRAEVGDPVRELRDQLRDALSAVSSAAELARRLPGLLGADGDRSWLVILQNPAEARGTGGFPGGYVRISARDGVLAVESTGKSSDLNSMPIPTDGAPQDSRLLWGPMLTQWRSFNLSPHFPLTGALAAASMDARGEPVDGVLAVDPSVVAAMLSVTGPVSVGATTLTTENAEQFFLVDVYAKFPDMNARNSLTLLLVGAVLKEFLSASWDPAVLASALAEPIANGGLRVWSANPDEEAWLASLSVGGVVPDTPGSVVAVAFNNAAGNKMDAFVAASVDYRPGRCESATVQHSGLTITLRNAAPENLPLVGGNYGRADTPNQPEGSTRLLVHLYAPVGASFGSSTLDGVEVPLYAGTERNRPVWWTYVTLERGQRKDLNVEFDEPSILAVDPAVLAQGMAVPEKVSVRPQSIC